MADKYLSGFRPPPNALQTSKDGESVLQNKDHPGSLRAEPIGDYMPVPSDLAPKSYGRQSSRNLLYQNIKDNKLYVKSSLNGQDEFFPAIPEYSERQLAEGSAGTAKSIVSLGIAGSADIVSGLFHLGAMAQATLSDDSSQEMINTLEGETGAEQTLGKIDDNLDKSDPRNTWAYQVAVSITCLLYTSPSPRDS